MNLIRTFLYFIIFSLPGCLLAQSASISGTVYGNSYQEPLSGVTVKADANGVTTITDSLGRYNIPNLADGTYRLLFSTEFFQPVVQKVQIAGGKSATVSVSLKSTMGNLKDITVSPIKGTTDNSGNLLISKIDIQLRPTNSAQDLLRMVPGLFIAQHAGGGKAEQLFLRGFDIDHGTDFAMTVDGIPVNMISHAHGQGYADLHFVIPETINQIDIFKGPYEARFGDLATAGAAEFKTANFIANNMVKLEAGQFNTFRALGMFKLLDQKHLFSKLKENAYIAGEYKYSDSYFDNPQHFNRVNVFGKYYGQLSNNASLTISGSYFSSIWDASGQIPERAVASGQISKFGSIDSTEGGNTRRANFSISLQQQLSPKNTLNNQVYYSRYDFELFSNFTFYKAHEDKGDGIKQVDHRNLLGYSSRLEHNGMLGKMAFKSAVGLGLRYDNSDLSLLHSQFRVVLDPYVHGTLNQLSASAYVDENLQVTSKFRINAGARLDAFNFDFQNKLDNSQSGTAFKSRVSPKLNFYYAAKQNVLLFLKSGIGFHSNDARGVVLNKTLGLNQDVLPRAYGSDLGSTFKVGRNLLVTTTLWTLFLDNELVYVGDEGIVEQVGKTYRYGMELSMRYQVLPRIYIDADANYNLARLANKPEGENYIPLAPIFTSIAGLSYKSPSGFNASLRYRYMGDRAANEDNSLNAEGYFLLDGVVQYNRPKYQIGLSVENMLNRYWKEAQFETESRLKTEAPGTSVTEIHYTPGTPFFAKLSVAYLF